jgi:hypothetical protein
MGEFWRLTMGDLVTLAATVTAVVAAYGRLAERLARVETRVDLLMSWTIRDRGGT